MRALARSEKVRNTLYQALALTVAVAIVTSFVLTARQNLIDQGIATGFGFLWRTTGWGIPFSLIDYGISSPYHRVLFAGFLNTIFAGIFSLFFATIFGTLIAMARVSTNMVLNTIGTAYVEIFRNIPLILQAFFWYGVVTHLPSARQAHEVMGAVFVSNRGVYVPWLNIPDGTVLFLFGLVAVAAVAAALLKRFPRVVGSAQATRMVNWGAVLAVLAIGLIAIIGTKAADAPLISVPQQRGFGFDGGLRIMPEFSALTISIIVYGSAYIGEIVRGGFLSVNRGQIETARALGLKPWSIYRHVRIPLALRAIMPPMGNQYVWLMKSTTVGIAIGFSDLFMVVSTSINQSGQTIELLFIMMTGFFIINYTISSGMNAINRKIAIKGYDKQGK